MVFDSLRCFDKLSLDYLRESAGEGARPQVERTEPPLDVNSTGGNGTDADGAGCTTVF